MVAVSGQLPVAPLCPSCGRKLDGFTATDLSSAVPVDGSFSLCFYCAALNVFEASPVTGILKLRPASPAETLEFRLQL